MSYCVYRYKGVKEPVLLFIESKEQFESELAKGDCMDATGCDCNLLPAIEPDWKPEKKAPVKKAAKTPQVKKPTARKTAANKASTTKASDK